ncbi:MAG: rod shape-determining protein [Solirubrobacteraceae bacterium]|jgi:rod shape-determining protein MreB and related proteins
MAFGRKSWGRDIAIDLGTANTLVFVRGAGIVASEPSVVALDTRTDQVHAVGSEAKRMIGRTPAAISAVRPLRHGVIADFEVTEQMLRYFIGRVHSSRFAHPRLVMCVPSGVTDVEKRAVEEACLVAGAREVHLMQESMAAAIGGDLPVAEPRASMVVDIGGGTSEVAVISLGAIVVSSSVRLGGYELDEHIAAHIRRRHQLAIGEQTAEDIKITLGSAGAPDPQASADIRGRDLLSGLPKSVSLQSQEVVEALSEPVDAILATVRETLEETPPELAADIVNAGIMLAGGGSLLSGLAERVQDETQMPTYLAHSPLTTVVEGAGRSLDELELLRQTKTARRSSAITAAARSRRSSRNLPAR